jgi:precorrin-2/cobalt-factor-2 C20-methyltransferase
MTNTYPLTGVGLGPGDPELITVKGLKALKQADVIFYPATSRDEGQIISYSKKILDYFSLEATCKPMLFPMKSKHRGDYYEIAYKAIRQDMQRGYRVAAVSEGDLLFYSTFGYLMKMAQADKLTCELIPGIPAFIHSAAIGQKPLLEDQEGLTVIARPHSFDQIQQSLSTGHTLVVMKMSLLRDNWPDFLAKCRNSFFYIEKAGTAEQFSTTLADDLINRPIPYFSLIIFYPLKNRQDV